MKKLAIAFIAFTVIASAGCQEPTTGDEPSSLTGTGDMSDTVAATTDTASVAGTTPPVDSATMAKAWEEYMTPGNMHKMMTSWNGKWNEDITMWMAPDAPPMTSKATAENRMILGGRYQESRHKGSFEGMPFEGISTMGYDNAKRKFVSSWVDNMGSGIMYMEGTWDSTAKAINFSGKVVDPVTKQEKPIREVMRIVDDRNQVMEMYDTQGGREYKSMEIRFTKQ